MSKTIEFEYRDGANYKWFPNIKISDAKIKEKKPTKSELTDLVDSFLDEV